MRIQLTKGQEVIVDDRDYEELSKANWYASFMRGVPYAARASSNLSCKPHLLLMHRFIWERHNGPIPKGKWIDHINGNTLDNQLKNLRLCTPSQNHANRKNLPHTSDFKGVCYDKARTKWQARIQYRGIGVFIGRFDSEIEAARAYDTKARELFGEFAVLNFPISASL